MKTIVKITFCVFSFKEKMHFKTQANVHDRSLNLGGLITCIGLQWISLPVTNNESNCTITDRHLHNIFHNCGLYDLYSNIGLIHVLGDVNIRRGPKNGLTPQCEARGC